ncbi:glycosyl hydrolase-related protein [Streptomyces sp. SPB074]|uniref:glycosyl hydrolase-related protein n=1 Tax=Streptomyces sp. (strain SPB074) TaxID=465543 RepID=UPI003B67730F
MRLYESRGGAVRAAMGAGFAVDSAAVTDLLEEPVTELDVVEGRVALALRPFQIVTVRLRRS